MHFVTLDCDLSLYNTSGFHCFNLFNNYFIELVFG